MLLVRYATCLCLIFSFQQGIAETENTTNNSIDEELDGEFLEVLGSVEAEEDEWFDIFLSTIDEANEDSTARAEYEADDE